MSVSRLACHARTALSSYCRIATASASASRCSLSACPTFLPRRRYHHSPSQNYLKLWNKYGVNYKKRMADDSPNMYQMPKVVYQTMQTEAAMKRMGYVPFVHATPAAAKVLRKFNELVFQKKPVTFF